MKNNRNKEHIKYIEELLEKYDNLFFFCGNNFILLYDRKDSFIDEYAIKVLEIEPETLKWLQITTPEQRRELERQSKIYYLEQELNRLKSK